MIPRVKAAVLAGIYVHSQVPVFVAVYTLFL